MEVLEASKLKKAKSVKLQPQTSKVVPLSHETGWEAAFNLSKKPNGLSHTNGVNGDSSNSYRESNSPDAVDFETYLHESQQLLGQKEKEKVKTGNGNAGHALKKQQSVESWKISGPIGGRMINVDPVFTPDEKYAS